MADGSPDGITTGPLATAATQLASGVGRAAVAAACVLVAMRSLDSAAHGWIVVVLLVALVLVGADCARVARIEPGPTTPPLLGSNVAMRSLIAMTTGVLFLAWSTSAAWVCGLAGVLSVCVALGEPVLAQAREYRVAFVSNLPGVRPAPALVDAEVHATVAHLVALAAGIALAAGGASVWWWVAVILVAAGPDVAMGLNAIARMRAGGAIERGLVAAVAAYAPEFVVYTAWPDDGTHQVTMWLPYLERTGRKYLVVARHNEPAELLAAQTDAPVVMRHGSRDLDDVVAPSLTTTFYVNASSGNSIFVRYHQLTHVFLGHGDSDKPTSYNPTHAMYDRIFAAGEAAIRRYAAHGIHIPRDKFDIVGRPQVETVARSDGPVASATPVVLYAPTWRGHVEETAFDSLPVGEGLVAGLIARGATVVFRPHPFSHGFPEDETRIRRIQALLESDARESGRPHLWGPAAETEQSVIDCINRADALVSDVSSVVSDFLFSGKPFAMVAMTSGSDEFVKRYPAAAAAYVVERDLSNLDTALDDLLGEDPLGAVRLGVRSDYLGNLPAEGYSDVFVDRAREIIDAPRPQPEDEEAAETDTDDAGARVSLSTIRSQLGIAARDVVTAGLAALVVLFCVVGAARVVPLLTVVLAVAAMVALHRKARPGNVYFDAIAGSFLPARLLIVLGLGVGWIDWHGWSWSATIGLVLLAAATAAEETVSDCWGRVGIEARNLPALRVQVPELVPRGYLGSAGIAVVALAWLLGVLGDTGGIVLALGALTAAALLLALVIGLVRVDRCVAAEQHLYGALAEHGPRFAVYFGSNLGAPYQMGMWMPYFERIGRPYVVVMRNLAMFHAVKTITDAPIIHRPSIRSLEDVVVPSLRASFYVNNATNNTHFVERRQMTHVWLNHGDSEKPACYNPVHAIYDRIFAAGQAGIDRYARHGVEIPEQKFQIVGRPQVEDVVHPTSAIADLDGHTVLYAPTWRGPYADSQVYSLPQGGRIVQALLDRGATVIFRSHVFNYRFPESVRAIGTICAMLEADRARTGRQHRYGPAAEQAMSLVDCFNASDAMVSDVSAVVSDYLQSGKPFAIVAVGRTPDQLRAEAPAAVAAYVISADLANLDSCLDTMLGPDPLASERDRTRVYYLGDFAETSYADGFLEASRALVDSRPDA